MMPAAPPSRRLTALAHLLRSAVKPPSAAELEHGLTALRAQSAPRTRSTGRRLPLRWAFIAALVVSGFLVWLAPSYLRSRSSLPERSVAVDRIEGGELLYGGYLSETGRSGIELSFNDGSNFDLEPGSRGRLRVVPAEGASLSLEQGTVACRITENQEHRWSVEAGPFVVAVRGTDFTVAWDPAHEHLDVSLRRGRVAVSGPVVGDELVLRPGQTLTVSLPRRESVIKEGRVEHESHSEEPASAPSTPPASSGALDLEAPGSPATGTPGEPKASSATSQRVFARTGNENERAWREAIATGQWDKILADADRDGAAAILQTLSSEDLLALADAARYRRRADLSRKALLEQRRRSPSSARSLDALFLLGRVEEQAQGGKREAIRRYDEYLAVAPSGTYAAEALGRRMILTKDVEGAASAARIAEEYLRRFPRGSYVQAARTLRHGP